MATKASPQIMHSDTNPAVEIEGIGPLCRNLAGVTRRYQPFCPRRGLYRRGENWTNQAARDHRVGLGEPGEVEILRQQE